MADRSQAQNSSEESGRDSSSIQQSPSRGQDSSPAAFGQNTEHGASSLNTNPEAPPGHGLYRLRTLPVRDEHSTNRPDELSPNNRRRGQTISSRRDLSPRSHLFGRNPSNADARAEDRMGSIPEGGRGSTDIGSRRPRRSNTSTDFVSPGMRRRVSTVTGRPRGQTTNQRPTIAVAAVASARDPDSQSQANFSVAGGNAIDTLAANQPYVDPGYGHLNPAYEQPVNVRPVWGLAKPLPRVIRPGMVPTRNELNLAAAQADQPNQDAANVDLEQGRIEPTLKVNQITSQLQSTREQRESNLLRTFSRTGPPISNFRRSSSIVPGQLTPSSQAIVEEGEDVGLHHLEPLDSVQEEPAETKLDGQLKPEPNWFPDDAASAITEAAQEGDLSGDYIHDEIPLPAYEEETDEIHNLHTHWSVIRLRFREPLAELLAVTVQLTVGFCADLAVQTSNGTAGSADMTHWAFGFATMMGIYIAGGISGAHLNPAISIMLYIYRGFPLRKVPLYVFAQILGAFIAALVAFGLYQKDIIEYGGADLGRGGTLASFICFPRYAWIDASTAFFTEFVGTACLAVTVLALGDDTNAPPGAGMNALVIGLVVTVLSMGFAYNTGAALNPSRDFGPRLALLALGYGSEVFTNGFWVYGSWVATITGAIFGAFLYDAAIFVGGESPVNYPRKRMKRAGYKWRKKWSAKLRAQRRKLRRRKADDETENGEKVKGKGSI